MAATILVIDDDPSIVNLLKEDLEQEGFLVVPGYDGKTALQLAKTHKPQLIIMDVNMPETSGPQALALLRGTPETRHIPILFLSGDESSHVDPKLESIERVAQVKKPVDLDDLNALVRQLLAKYPC